MWAPEIEDKLSSSKIFLGCFPMDDLPPFPQRMPASLIVNTDISTEIGDHWLALVLEEDYCYYFDSFGLPIMDETLIKYLESHYRKVTYSDVCIQHIESNKCGEFCIIFVEYVNSKTSYDKFLSNFNHFSIEKNDVIVTEWINVI